MFIESMNEDEARAKMIKDAVWEYEYHIAKVQAAAAALKVLGTDINEQLKIKKEKEEPNAN